MITVSSCCRAAGEPTRKRAIWSIGRCVADNPIRTGRREQSASSRSRVSAKCEPRLSRASAWISSTMTVSTAVKTWRLFSAVSIKYNDSGVVTRIWGGRRSILCRSVFGVSPVRTAVRIGGGSKPDASASCRISASGDSKLRWISLLRAFSGET